jgi:hypothetical protein
VTEPIFKIYFLLPLVFLVATLWPRVGRRQFVGLRRWFDRLALRRGLCFLLVGLFAFSLAALTSLRRVPAPQVSDEFGYLLMADTFATGRVTNPTHPLWQHFESVHIIHRPSYTAKYPPGQGGLLAIGERIFHPIVGVWIGSALAAMAVWWMLGVWMRPRWALLGTVLLVMHPLMLMWSHNYWGGGVAVVGGALMLGGLRRAARRWSRGSAFAILCGMLVLANCRPYEGFVLAAFVVLSVLWATRTRDCRPHSPFWMTFIIGAIVIAVQVGYYNQRVTGNPLKMPYAVHEDTYGVAPLFIWQKAKPEPPFLHKEIRDVQATLYLEYHAKQQTLPHLLKSAVSKVRLLCLGYLWSWLLVVPLLGIIGAFRNDKWVRYGVVVGGGFVLAMLLGTFVFPHYAAPAFALFLFVVLQAMRRLRLWKPGGRPVGSAIVRGTLLLCVISVPLSLWRFAQRPGDTWFFKRQEILQELESRPGQHLVIVRYSPHHNPNREWVYNRADIDSAKVILAREMGPANQALLDYYKNRQIWVLYADAPEPRVEPYRPL